MYFCPLFGYEKKEMKLLARLGVINSNFLLFLSCCRRILLIKFNPATASFKREQSGDQPHQEPRSSHYSLGSATTTAKVMLSEFTCSLPVVSSKIPFGAKETIYSEILCSGSFQSAMKPPDGDMQLKQEENKQKEVQKHSNEVGVMIDSNERGVDIEGRDTPSDEDFAKECLAVALADHGGQITSPALEVERHHENNDGQAVLAVYAKVDIVSKRSKHHELKREPSKESKKSIEEKISSHEIALQGMPRSTTSSSPPPLITQSSATSSIRSVSSTGSNRSRRMRSHISRIREGSGSDPSNSYKTFLEPVRAAKSPLADPRPSARF